LFLSSDHDEDPKINQWCVKPCNDTNIALVGQRVPLQGSCGSLRPFTWPMSPKSIFPSLIHWCSSLDYQKFPDTYTLCEKYRNGNDIILMGQRLFVHGMCDGLGTYASILNHKSIC
jgi:hypothetical protein